MAGCQRLDDAFFSCRANEPGYPYAKADYDTVYRECLAVMDEIERFAGYRGAVTTLHFAETPTCDIRASTIAASVRCWTTTLSTSTAGAPSVISLMMRS